MGRENSMPRLISRMFVVSVLFLLLPVAASAQGAITGVVKDTSGAVMPGVTVEASSPALIEKVRTAVTDGAGQYRIQDLRTGTYSVSFVLTGFNTVKRDGVEIQGTFVASVNTEMRVGTLQETITVSGETPVIDVKSAKQQSIVDKDVLAAIPNGRQITSVASLIPGISARADVGGSTANVSSTAGTIHGSQGNDTRSFTDGISIGWAGGANNQIMPNIGGSQEIVISTAGGLGEAETAGVMLNIIPRDGANTFKGSFFATGANNSMQSDNYTQALTGQGLLARNEVLKNYDINPMFGGRIVKDRLWFYLTARRFFQDNSTAGMFYNKNASTAWLYTPDLSRQAHSDTLTTSGSARLTFQISPRNKVNLTWDEQGRCVNCLGGGSALVTPEATSKNYAAPTRLQQATYQSPVTSRFLLDGGFGTYLQPYGERPRTDGFYDPTLIAATNATGANPGTLFRSPTLYWGDWVGTYTWRASVSYITGANSLKFGYTDGKYNGTRNRLPNNPSTGINTYNFNGFNADGSPRPASITVGAPISSEFRIHPMALYAQDSWTRGRLTLQGGVRYDWGTTNFGADPQYALDARYPQIGGQLGGATSPLVPVAIQFTDPALLTGVNFKDITPRMAATYDLLGDGKTAVKVSLGKYVSTMTGDGYVLDLNPANRALGTGGAGGTNPFGTTRSWNDLNGNLVPDCDLRNPAANQECGAYANQTFGKLIQGQQVFTNNFDSAVTTGWGVRPNEWDFSASVQRQLVPRVSVEVGYFRRWFGNLLATDNRSVAASDFDTFGVTVAEPRLPGGSATVSNLYNVTPSLFGFTDNIVTRAPGNPIDHWNGVDVNVNARLKAVTVRVGTSTGRRSFNTCDVRAALPETAVLNPFCQVDFPFLTDMRGSGSYTVPKVDVQVSANFSSIPGGLLAANAVLTNAQISPSLGRALAGGTQFVVVNLINPDAQPIGDRTNQLDLRFAKIFRFWGRANLGFDLYNIMNANPVQTYLQTFNPLIASGQPGAWLQPTSILPARLFKISVQFDF